MKTIESGTISLLILIGIVGLIAMFLKKNLVVGSLFPMWIQIWLVITTLICCWVRLLRKRRKTTNLNHSTSKT